MAVRLPVSRVDLSFYIVNLTTGSILKIEFLPDEVSDSNSANFGETAIQGRSSPLFSYQNSGPRTITTSVQLHDDYLPMGIDKTVRHFKALTYPRYSSSIIAPRVYVRLGNILKFTGICTDVSITWKKPIRNGMYINADVALTFKATQEIPLGATDLESNIGGQ